MSGGVDHEASPQVVGVVIDEYGPAIDNIHPALLLKNLRKRLQPPQKPHIIIRNKFPLLIRPNSQLITLMTLLLSNHLISILNHNIQTYGSRFEISAFEDLDQVQVEDLFDVVGGICFDYVVYVAGVYLGLFGGFV